MLTLKKETVEKNSDSATELNPTQLIIRVLLLEYSSTNTSLVWRRSHFALLVIGLQKS